MAFVGKFFLWISVALFEQSVAAKKCKQKCHNSNNIALLFSLNIDLLAMDLFKLYFICSKQQQQQKTLLEGETQHS